MTDVTRVLQILEASRNASRFTGTIIYLYILENLQIQSLQEHLIWLSVVVAFITAEKARDRGLVVRMCPSLHDCHFIFFFFFENNFC